MAKNADALRKVALLHIHLDLRAASFSWGMRCVLRPLVHVDHDYYDDGAQSTATDRCLECSLFRGLVSKFAMFPFPAIH